MIKRKNHNRQGMILSSLVVMTGIIMMIPFLYVFIRAFEAEPSRWKLLWDGKIPFLLEKTFSLTIVVTFLAICIGVSLAFLVFRTNLPMRRFFNVAVSLPIVIPPYVGAMAYITLIGPGGLFENDALTIYSFWGTVFVLTGFTYPYVYFIVSALLKKMNRSLEEVGIIAGLTKKQVFLKITLPLLLPAISAGGLLVALYVISDFGAVAMLRYPTFAQAIYFQMGSFDRYSAAILSVILIVATFILLGLQVAVKRKMRFYQVGKGRKEGGRISLGKGKWIAFSFTSIIFLLYTVAPIMTLIYWTFTAIQKGKVDVLFSHYAWNSFSVSFIAMLLCILLAFPLVYVKSRYPNKMGKVVNAISYTGYALPGVIVALGVIFVFIQYIPLLYGTLIPLVVAYIIRFLPQSIQTLDASISQLPPTIDEAAQLLGRTPFQTMMGVVFKNMIPGLLAGGALVFVSVMKELPATLLLRPAGFDTLAVRVWIETSEGFYDVAAPSALVIILVAALPLKYMLEKE